MEPTPDSFHVFMRQHPPLGMLVADIDTVIWDEGVVDDAIKERARIATAEELGCSYCVDFRTERAGRGVILDREQRLRADPRQAARLEMAERYARQMVITGGAVDDALTVEMQRHFEPDEFADLVFAICYHIGMQYVGRAMHWDHACPVPQIAEASAG